MVSVKMEKSSQFNDTVTNALFKCKYIKGRWWVQRKVERSGYGHFKVF